MKIFEHSKETEEKHTTRLDRSRLGAVGLNASCLLFFFLMLDGLPYYEVDDIIESRKYYGRLQYKVKWSDIDNDDNWYYADAGEFDNAPDIVHEFFKKYPGIWTGSNGRHQNDYGSLAIMLYRAGESAGVVASGGC